MIGRLKTAVRRCNLYDQKVAILLALTSLAIVANSSFGHTFPLDDGPGGASCEYFNLDGRIRWVHRQGDWKDATGTDQGAVPFSEATVNDSDRVRSIEWDVTSLVKGWRDGTYPNHGFLLAPVAGRVRGESVFFSREADDPRVHPRLELVFSDGTRDLRSPVADTYLHCSTAQSIGMRKKLSGGVDSNLMLLFDVGRSAGAAPIFKAILVLTTTEAQFGRTTLGVFRLNPPSREQTATTEVGLAAAYRHDRGIAEDPGVLMATGFDSSYWKRDWSYVSDSKSFDVVSRDAALSFEALLGSALRVRIPAGGNLGLDMGYNFKEKVGSEPDEIYFRYYLRFAEDWRPFVEGGKLPGLSGTYGVAGWGGRKSDGTNGWSLRGLFLQMPERGPLHDITPIGTYAYHAETRDAWGDHWLWSNGQRGLLQRNKWYCIEQHVRVNSVGQRNGVMRAWVDGELAFEKTDVHLRDVPALRIEKVWMNVYHGGSTPSPYDQHLFIDNVVVARRYIGPMASE